MAAKKHREKSRISKKDENKKRRAQSQASRRLMLWAVVLVGLGVVVFGIVRFASSPDVTAPMGAREIEISQEEWIKGNPGSKVTLLEYSDFQCPACGAYHPLLKRINAEFGDRIRFIYRHFPLTQVHRHAELAAQSAEAAGRQGRFWEMHDLIFEYQEEWSGQRDVRERFLDYARQLGLDMARFQEDLDAKSTRQAVEADLDSGVRLGVNGTPTFFLNGVKLQNPRSYDGFRDLIERAVSRAS